MTETVWVSAVSISALAVDSTDRMDRAEAADWASCQASKTHNETGPRSIAIMLEVERAPRWRSRETKASG
ncbi:hypothetical protein HZ326_4523 [Fusarium oxysporum f. sp. albedinis]|nr:hypothetical protein HZ326_4523 [Fusarium oxysporum f. sp. albedinis]